MTLTEMVEHLVTERGFTRADAEAAIDAVFNPPFVRDAKTAGYRLTPLELATVENAAFQRLIR
jgi:hypothetical protein